MWLTLQVVFAALVLAGYDGAGCGMWSGLDTFGLARRRAEGTWSLWCGGNDLRVACVPVATPHRLADLQSSVAVQTWIDADRRYDLAGHAKLANTIRPTIDYIGPPSPGGPERWFVRPGRLGGSGATTT